MDRNFARTSAGTDDNTGTPDECEDLNPGSSAATSIWQPMAQKEFSGTEFPAYASPSGAVLIHFASPHSFRLQLRVRSCDLWFPSIILGGLGPAYDFMSRMMPRSPALAVASDASSSCCVGQWFKDERLLRGGQMLYSKALQLLRHELDTPKDRSNRALTAAILTLQVNQTFTSMDFSGDTWLQHSAGLTKLIENLQETEAEMEDEGVFGYEQMLLASFHAFDFWAGLINKRPIRCFGTSGGGNVLTSIAERIPGALGTIDVLCRKSQLLSTQEAADAIDMLTALEAELMTWTSAWNPSMRSAPFSVVNVFTLSGYKTPTELSRNPFALGMNFNSFHNAQDHCVCTASLLAVRRAMIDVCRAITSTWMHVNISFEERIRKLVAAATTCADSLCMSIPYFFHPDFSSYGHIMTLGPLYEATNWYSRLEPDAGRSVSHKLQWCQQTARQLRRLGVRPR